MKKILYIGISLLAGLGFVACSTDDGEKDAAGKIIEQLNGSTASGSMRSPSSEN